MIVDFHTHVFPDEIAQRAVSKLADSSHTRPFLPGTVQALIRSRTDAGIDRCVVLPVATSPHQVRHINDRALKLNETAEQTGVWSLGCMHPEDADWHSELSRLASAGIRGIKLHPPFQQTDIDDPKYLRILSRAGELGLFVLVHAGLDVGLPGNTCATPEKIARALARTGPVTMVCAHMGGWRCWREAAELLPPFGVLIDTSFAFGRITPGTDGFSWKEQELQMLREADFLQLVRQFGPDHVLFGTDSPWADQRKELAQIRALPLSDEELSAILGGSACRLMGW